MDMEQEYNLPPLDEVVTELLEGEPLPVHQVFRLSDLEPAAFETFCQRFAAADRDRRQALVRHMADISEEDFVTDFAPVFRFCLDDPDAPVRQAALDGLWDTEDPRLIPRIVGLLESDPDAEVRKSAAAALSHFVMLAEWGEISERAAAPILPALLAAYDDPDAPLPVRRAALEALGAASHPRVPALIEQAYESGDPELQLSAVFAMGNSADTRWLRHVLDELESPVMEMRAEAARSAGSLGSSDAVDRLKELVFDAERDVALTAVAALGQIGGDNVAAFLAELSEDEEVADMHDAIDEALEELTMMSGAFDMLSFAPDDSELDDALDVPDLDEE